MASGVDAHIWSDESVVANAHIGLVEHGETEVGEHAMPQMYVAAVVAQEWLQNGAIVVKSAQQLL